MRTLLLLMFANEVHPTPAHLPQLSLKPLSSIHSLVTRSPEPAGGAGPDCGPSVPVGAALPTRRAQLPAASETFLLLETPSPGALTSKHPRPASLDGWSEGRADLCFYL